MTQFFNQKFIIIYVNDTRAYKKKSIFRRIEQLDNRYDLIAMVVTIWPILWFISEKFQSNMCQLVLVPPC
jgi:hypothetical protein